MSPLFVTYGGAALLLLTQIPNRHYLTVSDKPPSNPNVSLCRVSPVAFHDLGVSRANSAQPGEPDDLAIAEDLMRTCYEMYRRTATGLAPELAFFITSEAEHGVVEQQTADNTGGGDFITKHFVSQSTS